MSNSPQATADGMKDKASSTAQTIKEAAQETVIDPAIEAGKEAYGAMKDGAGKVADATRSAAHSTDEWVNAHAYSSAGIAFGLGVLLGVLVTAELKR